MPILMKFKDPDQVFKETSKIEASLNKAKVDEKKIKAFRKELNQKKKRLHDKFLDAINEEKRIKNFEAEKPTGDGGFSKELAAAYKRVDLVLALKGGQVQLNVNTDIVVGT